MQPIVGNLTSDFFSILKRLNENGDIAELKPALRACIDIMENYYNEL